MNVVASRGIMVHGFLRSVFEALDRHSTSVDIVAISEVSMSFTMETKRHPESVCSPRWKRSPTSLAKTEQAIICLVGEDIHGKPGIAASVFNTIAEAEVNIRMISQGASEINISFVVKESDVPRAVRSLHEHFFPTKGARNQRRAPCHERRGNSSDEARRNLRAKVKPRRCVLGAKEAAVRPGLNL